MHLDSKSYNKRQPLVDGKNCDLIAQNISSTLPEAGSMFWHAHPVWFLQANPIVGYTKLKDYVRLQFWSGQSFQTRGLTKTGSFTAAEVIPSYLRLG
jgi:hypothetical protein